MIAKNESTKKYRSKVGPVEMSGLETYWKISRFLLVPQIWWDKRQDIIGIQKNGLADGIPVVDCDSPKKIVFFLPPEISNQDLLLTYIPYSNDSSKILLIFQGCSYSMPK